MGESKVLALKFLTDFVAELPLLNSDGAAAGNYALEFSDILEEALDASSYYLEQRRCPHGLRAFLAKKAASALCTVLDETEACPYSTSEVLHMATLDSLNKLCHNLLEKPELIDSSALEMPLPFVSSEFAIKNRRRKMEDRHVVIHDLNLYFPIDETPKCSYYAVFDGHAGIDAATYAAAHLHANIINHTLFQSDTTEAISQAYAYTDKQFCERANKEGIRGGCTAVSALIMNGNLYIAWLGDSQAILAKQGKPITLMNPHKPDRQDERERIEELGGFVCHLGTWRVNGTLAVSRAIGDYEFKPYVCSQPEITVTPLDGTEDFLVLACDGLWDCLTPEDVTATLYTALCTNPDDSMEDIAEKLVYKSKDMGSDDNITAVVVFLRNLADVAKEAVNYSFPDANSTDINLKDGGNCGDLTKEEAIANFLIQENHNTPERPNILHDISEYPSLKSECKPSNPPPEATFLSELPTPPIDDLVTDEVTRLNEELSKLRIEENVQNSHMIEACAFNDQSPKMTPKECIESEASLKLLIESVIENACKITDNIRDIAANSNKVVPLHENVPGVEIDNIMRLSPGKESQHIETAVTNSDETASCVVGEIDISKHERTPHENVTGTDLDGSLGMSHIEVSQHTETAVQNSYVATGFEIDIDRTEVPLQKYNSTVEIEVNKKIDLMDFSFEEQQVKHVQSISNTTKSALPIVDHNAIETKANDATVEMNSITVNDPLPEKDFEQCLSDKNKKNESVSGELVLFIEGASAEKDEFQPADIISIPAPENNPVEVVQETKVKKHEIDLHAIALAALMEQNIDSNHALLPNNDDIHTIALAALMEQNIDSNHALLPNNDDLPAVVGDSDLNFIPENIPEADCVAEDNDSESENNCGWSFVKPANDSSADKEVKDLKQSSKAKLQSSKTLTVTKTNSTATTVSKSPASTKAATSTLKAKMVTKAGSEITSTLKTKSASKTGSEATLKGKPVTKTGADAATLKPKPIAKTGGDAATLKLKPVTKTGLDASTSKPKTVLKTAVNNATTLRARTVTKQTSDVKPSSKTVTNRVPVEKVQKINTLGVNKATSSTSTLKKTVPDSSPKPIVKAKSASGTTVAAASSKPIARTVPASKQNGLNSKPSAPTPTVSKTVLKATGSTMKRPAVAGAKEGIKVAPKTTTLLKSKPAVAASNSTRPASATSTLSKPASHNKGLPSGTKLPTGDKTKSSHITIRSPRTNTLKPTSSASAKSSNIQTLTKEKKEASTNEKNAGPAANPIQAIPNPTVSANNP